MKTTSFVLPILGSVVLPMPVLLIWLAITITLDFITGIIKSTSIGDKRVSKKYRETAGKIFQYCGTILISIILSSVVITNSVPNVLYDKIISYFTNTIVGFMIFIETTSIFENLYTIDQKSKFSRYFIKPMLTLLSFRIKLFSDTINLKKDDK